MSATPKARQEGLMGLTLSEARLMLLGLLCTDTSGKVDFERLAAAAPYKNASSAGVCYRAAKKKFVAHNGDGVIGTESPGNGTGTGTASTLTPAKKTPAKRKKAQAPVAVDTDVANDGNNAGEEDACATPTPKPKRQRKSAAAPVPVKEQEDVAMKTGAEAVKEEEQKERENGLVKTEAEAEPELEQIMNPSPIKPQVSVHIRNLSITDSKNLPVSANIHYPTAEEEKEEEELMTQLSIETEFAAMDRNRQLAEARSGSAWLAELLDAV